MEVQVLWDCSVRLRVESMLLTRQQKDSRGGSERMLLCRIVCSWLPAWFEDLFRVRLLSSAPDFTNYMFNPATSALQLPHYPFYFRGSLAP